MSTEKMSKEKAKVISTADAPAAIGPYSQAVKAGNTVYLSGQIALDPVSMEIVAGGFSDQAEQVFKNLQAVAEAAGSTLDDAVKLMVYLTDLDYFDDVNNIMARYFTQPYPARAAVQVSALPRGAQLEIDAVLYLAE